MKRPSVKRLFRFPTRSRQELAADAREEVQFHVDMRADDLRHRGLTEADARAQAVREFGDLDPASRAASAMNGASNGDGCCRACWAISGRTSGSAVRLLVPRRRPVGGGDPDARRGDRRKHRHVQRGQCHVRSSRCR